MCSFTWHLVEHDLIRNKLHVLTVARIKLCSSDIGILSVLASSEIKGGDG